jgi:hypothetical protein
MPSDTRWRVGLVKARCDLGVLNPFVNRSKQVLKDRPLPQG